LSKGRRRRGGGGGGVVKGVGKGEGWGRRCEEGRLVREGPSPCAMYRVGGRPPGPSGESVEARYCHPHPVAIGVDGWRCP